VPSAKPSRLIFHHGTIQVWARGPGQPKSGIRSSQGGAILIAAPSIIYGLVGMGAKYLPTIKDTKASQRYRRKQGIQPLPVKAADVAPAPKRSRK